MKNENNTNIEKLNKVGTLLQTYWGTAYPKQFIRTFSEINQLLNNETNEGGGLSITIIDEDNLQKVRLEIDPLSDQLARQNKSRFFTISRVQLNELTSGKDDPVYENVSNIDQPLGISFCIGKETVGQTAYDYCIVAQLVDLSHRPILNAGRLTINTFNEIAIKKGIHGPDELIITDKGISKSYDHGKGEEFIKSINEKIATYWSGWSNSPGKDETQEKYPHFFRSREELESLAGLGDYSKINHRYENINQEIIGIEIAFENVSVNASENASENDRTKIFPRLRPFTIWDTLNDKISNKISTFPATPGIKSPIDSALINARVVVTKDTVAALVRHIDPLLACNFNPHRAFLLEITIGKEGVNHVIILRHVHHFIPNFKCAESHNPVRIPSE